MSLQTKVGEAVISSGDQMSSNAGEVLAGEVVLSTLVLGLGVAAIYGVGLGVAKIANHFMGSRHDAEQRASVETDARKTLDAMLREPITAEEIRYRKELATAVCPHLSEQQGIQG